MNRIKFGALRKTVTDAVTTAAHGARDLAFDAKEALDRALTAKCLRAYTVGKQIATSGPQGLWKIYTADYKNPGKIFFLFRERMSRRGFLSMCQRLDFGKKAIARRFKVRIDTNSS